MKLHFNKSASYLFLLIGIVIIITICYQSGFLRVHKIQHDFNRPAIQAGDIFFTSNLKKPKRFALISFREPRSGILDIRMLAVLRLAGLPGDTIEIRNGDLYVNNEPADEKIDIIREYAMHQRYSGRVISLLNYDTIRYRMYHLWDSVYLQLSAKQKRQLDSQKIPYVRRFYKKYEFMTPLYERYKSNWNEDQFGPYIVPKDSCFLLGDNRKSCLDSRIFGPIALQDYEGTVLNH